MKDSVRVSAASAVMGALPTPWIVSISAAADRLIPMAAAAIKIRYRIMFTSLLTNNDLVEHLADAIDGTGDILRQTLLLLGTHGA